MALVAYNGCPALGDIPKPVATYCLVIRRWRGCWVKKVIRGEEGGGMFGLIAYKPMAQGTNNL